MAVSPSLFSKGLLSYKYRTCPVVSCFLPEAFTLAITMCEACVCVCGGGGGGGGGELEQTTKVLVRNVK